jgi:hypothetical protein
MRHAVGPALPRSRAAWGGDRWPLIAVVERAIGLLFRSNLDRVLTRFHNDPLEGLIGCHLHPNTLWYSLYHPVRCFDAAWAALTYG